MKMKKKKNGMMSEKDMEKMHKARHGEAPKRRAVGKKKGKKGKK